MSNFRQKNEPSSKLLTQVSQLDYVQVLQVSFFFLLIFFKLLTFCFLPPDLQIPVSERAELKYSLKAAVPSTFQIKKNQRIL